MSGHNINKLPTSIKVIYLLGVTLIELILVLAILSVIVAVAIPSYQDYIKQSDIAIATADIKMIEQSIERFYLINDRYPLNASELALPNDPWGNPYVFLNFDTIKGKGKQRKDKNLVPINTDYDLYSKGPDGRSVSPLTSKLSLDDIVRANNGSFVGVAENY
ncbi:MAG: prepilin-type N-terminal cleavage/methylation domain-containing protein [Pseudomonadota bacterium]